MRALGQAAVLPELLRPLQRHRACVRLSLRPTRHAQRRPLFAHSFLWPMRRLHHFPWPCLRRAPMDLPRLKNPHRRRRLIRLLRRIRWTLGVHLRHRPQRKRGRCPLSQTRSCPSFPMSTTCLLCVRRSARRSGGDQSCALYRDWWSWFWGACWRCNGGCKTEMCWPLAVRNGRRG